MSVIIGLTGSIGMGKSTAAGMLSHMGCAIFDSDGCVKKALDPHGDAFESVALTFPNVWNKKTRLIDKKKLADIVFNDSDEKVKLENILHPIVHQQQDSFILRQTLLGRDFIILDIPLLFETGANQRMDKTIVVTAPYFIQRQRVLARKDMSKEKFQSIVNNQMPDSQKKALANFVVQTGLGKAYTYRNLQKIMRDLS